MQFILLVLKTDFIKAPSLLRYIRQVIDQQRFKLVKEVSNLKFIKMKNVITILTAVFLMVSCKKEETKTANDAINEVKETTEIVAKEGSGKVVLTCNNKEFVSEGVCGALVSMGQLTMAVKDKTNPAKVFTITFNGE